MPGVIRVYCIFNHGRAPNDSMGAHIAGGRWNPPGYPVLYTSSHLSLACLEKLIHLRLRYAWADLPGDLTSLMSTAPPSATRTLIIVAGKSSPYWTAGATNASCRIHQPASQARHPSAFCVTFKAVGNSAAVAQRFFDLRKSTCA